MPGTNLCHLLSLWMSTFVNKKRLGAIKLLSPKVKDQLASCLNKTLKFFPLRQVSVRRLVNSPMSN